MQLGKIPTQRMSQIEQPMRQNKAKILANKSGDFFINPPIRKLVLCANKTDENRQNVSQPMRWLETAAHKARLTQVANVLTFLPKVHRSGTQHPTNFIAGMFLDLIKIIIAVIM